MIRSALYLTALMMLTGISGCVSMPKPLAGDFAFIQPADVAKNETMIGQQVRWGGTILKTYTVDDDSCMEVLGQTLDESLARPVAPDISTGRFVACKSGFLDPAIFAAGREVTVTGRIQAVETTQINDFDYRYAVIATEVLLLWPEQNGGYYAGSSYQEDYGYYVARYRQPSYYGYGYYGSAFAYPWYFGGFGHSFYGHGLYGGHYRGGFYGYPGYYGGFRGGYGFRGDRRRFGHDRHGFRSSRSGRSPTSAARVARGASGSSALSASAGVARSRQ